MGDRKVKLGRRLSVIGFTFERFQASGTWSRWYERGDRRRFEIGAKESMRLRLVYVSVC